MISLDPAGPDDLDAVRALLREYQREIGVDLCFQDFEGELRSLPGAYVPPRGALLLLRVRGEPAGCVALRPWGEHGAEMKRLYLARAHRGRGLGRRLATAAIEAARRAGHRVLRLDTLPSMIEAAALYESLGFREVPPPAAVPFPGMRYFERELNDGRTAGVDQPDRA